jgi:hypothetical protein
MPPRGNPAKSLGSQPLVEVAAPAARSTGRLAAATSPLPEKANGRKSSSARGAADVPGSSSSGALRLRAVVASKRWTSGR